MKNFCKQIDNFDAAVFSVFNQDFLFSASTVTYFPITKCAKDILLSDYFDLNRVSDSITSKYSSDEISLTCKNLMNLNQIMFFQKEENMIRIRFYIRIFF